MVNGNWDRVRWVIIVLAIILLGPRLLEHPPSLAWVLFMLCLSVLIAGASYTQYKWALIPLLLLVTLPVYQYYFADHDLLTLGLQEEPLREIPSPQMQVTLGGESIYVFGEFEATVCFYLDNEIAVIASHYCSGIEVGETYQVQVYNKSVEQNGWARVLTNSDWGVVLALQDFDVSAFHRPVLSLAGTGDIRIGDRATLHSTQRGDFPVKVHGFRRAPGAQFLVVRALEKAHPIEPGMSGSPLVQGDKLIGFISGSYTVATRPPSIGLARVATDVYLKAEGYLGANSFFGAEHLGAKIIRVRIREHVCPRR